MTEPATPTKEFTSYDANCHCGAVTFTVKVPSLKDHKVMSCNCSLCTRNGYLMIYPHRKDIIFHSGYDNLTSYLVLSKNVHKFCKTCGSSVIGESIGNDLQDDCVAINVSDQSPPVIFQTFLVLTVDVGGQVRMIKNIDVDGLKLQYYDGRAAKPEYDIGKPTPDSENSSTTSTAMGSELTSYPGNCHCGAVRYTVRIPSLLADHKVTSCNCSICVRNGYLFVYPEREHLTFHAGYDHLHSYRFGAKKKPHKFCPTCGSSVLGEASDRLGLNVSVKINQIYIGGTSGSNVAS
jgi:hypothetical protein